jgi:hypothetical protein
MQMTQFKCVPGPGMLFVKSLEMDSLTKAVGLYGDIITGESVGGWEFYGIYPFQVCQKAGFFSSFVFKEDDKWVDVNMLVFKKE